MHVEKNVGESLTGTMLDVPNKTKDRLKAREDLKSLGFKPELVPKPIEGYQLLIPASSFTLTPKESNEIYRLQKSYFGEKT